MASVRDGEEQLPLPSGWRKHRTSLGEQNGKRGTSSPRAEHEHAQRNEPVPQLRSLVGTGVRFADQLVSDELADAIVPADLVRGCQPLVARLLLREQGREVYLPWGLTLLDEGRIFARCAPAAALSLQAPETSAVGAGPDGAIRESGASARLASAS